jgi:drug/metabolite transporter (DMT)-like permease
MDLWVAVTIFAAAVQTVRFMLQKRLKGAGLSTGGATFSRFLFAAPLAALLVAGLMLAQGLSLPPTTLRFWGFALGGGVFQIVGTMCTVALFGLRNFAVGLAFTKTETVQVAIFSALVLGEAVTGTGLLAILIGLVGVILLSLPPREIGGGLWNRATALGLLGGAAFGLSAIGYRGAALDLGDGANPARSAACCGPGAARPWWASRECWARWAGSRPSRCRTRPMCGHLARSSLCSGFWSRHWCSVKGSACARWRAWLPCWRRS